MHAQRKSPHFWSEGKTHILLNVMIDLDINRFLDMHKYQHHPLQMSHYIKVTTRNFPFLLILAAPLDKSCSDTSTYCPQDLRQARQAELGITPATRAFVLEASEKETSGWIVMR